MQKFFNLDVISAEKIIFSNLVRQIIITGSEGEFGILPNHISFLTTIKPGFIKIMLENMQIEYIYLSGGIFEIYLNKAIVLVDTAIRGKEIDKNRAIKSKQKAKNLIHSAQEKQEYIRAMVELSKSIAKLRTYYLSKKN
ncbi:MAG: ATP synthase F1 subunit epsilon [Wigglesworthia glossinidia]|nr:ATP synthase F1 subunit epsilon [Wigglesworthia glossinidia]